MRIKAILHISLFCGVLMGCDGVSLDSEKSLSFEQVSNLLPSGTLSEFIAESNKVNEKNQFAKPLYVFSKGNRSDWESFVKSSGDGFEQVREVDCTNDSPSSFVEKIHIKALSNGKTTLPLKKLQINRLSKGKTISMLEDASYLSSEPKYRMENRTYKESLFNPLLCDENNTENPNLWITLDDPVFPAGSLLNLRSGEIERGGRKYRFEIVWDNNFHNINEITYFIYGNLSSINSIKVSLLTQMNRILPKKQFERVHVQNDIFKLNETLEFFTSNTKATFSYSCYGYKAYSNCNGFMTIKRNTQNTHE